MEKGGNVFIGGGGGSFKKWLLLSLNDFTGLLMSVHGNGSIYSTMCFSFSWDPLKDLSTHGDKNVTHADACTRGTLQQQVQVTHKGAVASDDRVAQPRNVCTS